MIGFSSRATLSNSRNKLFRNRLVLINSAVLRNWERVPCTHALFSLISAKRKAMNTVLAHLNKGVAHLIAHPSHFLAHPNIGEILEFAPEIDPELAAWYRRSGT